MLEDEKILALYWARDTAAIQETGVKYGERLLRLSGRDPYAYPLYRLIPTGEETVWAMLPFY